MSLGSARDRRVCICVCGEVGGVEKSSLTCREVILGQDMILFGEKALVSWGGRE